MESPTAIIYQDQKPVLVRRQAVVAAVSGPDAGTSCTLSGKPIRVGTAPDNDLVLTDSHVSRHHAEFRVHDQGYSVRDLGSTNGTIYRGARIHEAVIGPASEVRLGTTVLRLQPGEQTSEPVQGQHSFEGLVGRSSAMQEVYGLLSAVAPTDATVLVEGETGTGKELVAEAIHRHSPRAQASFCIVDCGAMPDNLIESELFGHEKGAFTGAVKAREGVFERARGGTVFLDEIGELPTQLQTRLLRVLDRRQVKRVGGNIHRRVDVRLVAATNRDLATEVQAGRFRQDLFYRLAVVRIAVPPLRHRGDDIALLARHFLWQAGCADPHALLTPEMLRLLQSRRWNGNVRELRNAIEEAMVLVDGGRDPLRSSRLANPLEGGDSGRSEAFEHGGPSAVAAAAGPAATTPVPQRPWAPSAAHHSRDLAATPTPHLDSTRGVAAPAEPARQTDTDRDRDDDWLARALPPGFIELPYKDAKESLLYRFERLYLRRMLRLHGDNLTRIAREAGVDRQIVRRLLRRHDMGQNA